MAEEEGFVARWSRRKRVAVAEEAAPKPDARQLAAEEEARAEAAAAEAAEEEANRLAAEALDLDALRYGDDFSVFLKRGVPDILRRRALRKFFASDPLLANLDGLNDYDEDYNNPAHKVYKSAWDAAKGYAEKAQEMVADAAEKAPETPVEIPTAEGTDSAGEAPQAVEKAAPPIPEPEPEPEAEAPRRVSLRRRLEV